MHAAVMAGFPPSSATHRPIWRIDQDDPKGIALFVVSDAAPSFEHIIEQFGWPSSNGVQVHTKPYQPFLDRLSVGEEYAFRLTANPTVSVSDRSNGKRRGTVVPLTTRTQQLEWLDSRAAKCGFELLPSSAADSVGDPSIRDVVLSRQERCVFTKGRGDDQRKVTLSLATFEGRLRVEDSARLAESLTGGVGRAKGYGCGLMTLAPTTRSNG